MTKWSGEDDGPHHKMKGKIRQQGMMETSSEGICSNTRTTTEHFVLAPTLQSSRYHLKTFILQQSFCL